MGGCASSAEKTDVASLNTETYGSLQKLHTDRQGRGRTSYDAALVSKDVGRLNFNEGTDLNEMNLPDEAYPALPKP